MDAHRRATFQLRDSQVGPRSVRANDCVGLRADECEAVAWRREASVVVREYEEDGLGLLYYDLDAADGDEDTRLVAARRLVHEVARSISATFVGPWP